MWLTPHWLRRVALLLAVLAVASSSMADDPVGAGESDHVVAGVVRDRTGVLPGAEVALVELARVTHSDDSGRFELTGVPRGRFTLLVRLQGFVPKRAEIGVPVEEPLELWLEPDLRFAEQIIVSAAPWALRPLETVPQTDQVTTDQARRGRIASIGEALSHVPGVAFIPTGNALGTPVIRGISENRIRVLNDGVPLNHQQWSWRHSPNVEATFGDRLELVRGPATVLHGPEAMGGVINVIHAPLPTAGRGERRFHGELTPGYSWNAGEWAGQARLEGALGAFGWRGEVIRREGKHIRTPRGRLDNTDFAQTNASITAGVTGSRGTTRVRWHHWEVETGFHRPAGFRLGLHDDLVVVDTRWATRAGAVDLTVSRQQNHRQAYATAGAVASVDLVQRTTSAKAGWLHSDRGHWKGRVGAEFQQVTNDQRAGALVPPYQSRNWAVLVYEEARFAATSAGPPHRFLLSFGARIDGQRMRVTRPHGQVELDHGAVTGVLGAVVRLHETLALATSVGRGWRPPNAFELFASGVHGGVAAFQVGNTDLVEESNVNAEASLRHEGRLGRLSVTVFRNAVDNYIYLADTGRLRGGVPILEHRQGDAVLRGVEVAAGASPRPWLALSLAYGHLATHNESTGRRLPQTPPDRLTGGIRFIRQRLGPLRDAEIGVDALWVARGKVSGPDEPFGTPTRPYELVNLRAGATLGSAARPLEIAVVVNNVFDREYRDFLWSYKAFAPNPGRDVRLTTTWKF